MIVFLFFVFLYYIISEGQNLYLCKSNSKMMLYYNATYLYILQYIILQCIACIIFSYSIDIYILFYNKIWHVFKLRLILILTSIRKFSTCQYKRNTSHTKNKYSHYKKKKNPKNLAFWFVRNIGCVLLRPEGSIFTLLLVNHSRLQLPKIFFVYNFIKVNSLWIDTHYRNQNRMFVQCNYL